MHGHVYHEGVGKKGANNVCSLLMKTLTDNGVINEDVIGGELNVVFDNCSGQNKNNTVIKLVPYLVEMGYFKKVNFIFLVVGHTKNAADRLFNALKKEYRHKNIYVMSELIDTLSVSKNVSVYATKEEDFLDWDEYLSMFYASFIGKIKLNHIFSCGNQSLNENGTQLIVKIRKSDREMDEEVEHKAIQRGFEGQNALPSLIDAVKNRPNVMKSISPKVIVSQGLNPFKKVEMNEKYKQFIPIQHHDSELYQPPTEKEKVMVKEERDKRVGIKKNKKLKMMKEATMMKIEKMAVGDVGDKLEKKIDTKSAH